MAYAFNEDKSKVDVYSKDDVDDAIEGFKNITISTSEPTSSDGENGDVWLVYEA